MSYYDEYLKVINLGGYYKSFEEWMKENNLPHSDYECETEEDHEQTPKR